MDDIGRKYGNFSFDSDGKIRRSSENTQDKINELMNDEDLKEALKKMKGEESEKAMLHQVQVQEKFLQLKKMVDLQ